MAYYALSGLVNAVTSIVLGAYLVIARGWHATSRLFGLWCLSVGGWSFGYYFWQTAQSSESALFWAKVLMAFAIIIPVFILHFTVQFLNIFPQKRRLITVYYLISLAYLAADIWTNTFISKVEQELAFPYWPKPGFLFHPYLAMFLSSVAYSHYLLWKEMRVTAGQRRLQIRYVFWGVLTAFAGGSTNFPLWYGIPIPPVGNGLVIVYVITVTYAIVRHRLMEGRLAIARGAIFVLLHAVAIGAPFFLAMSGKDWLESHIGENWWMAPFGLLAALSSLVPAVYGFLQAHAEARIFRTERRYQAAVRTMSQELVGFTDVKGLCSFVGRHVGDQMGLTSAELIVQGNGFSASHAVDITIPSGVKEVLQRWIGSPSRADPYIVAEELWADRPDTEIRALRTWMTRSNISALVPGYLRGKLVTCLVLGHKRTGAIFSPEDFEVLEALARQSALVITNLGLLDEVHTQRRLAEFGELMNAINHEFNNIFVIISGTLQLLVESPNNPALRQELAGLQDEILRGQYIIRSASAYRKKHHSSLEAWTLATVIETALTQAKQDAFAGAKPQFTITTSIPQEVELLGRATIPELVVNALRCLGWACDSKPGTLSVEVEIASKPAMLQLRFAMTGGEDLQAVIEKEGALAPEPGRHGGLYYFLVKLIVADHQGSLAIESTPGGGTTLLVRLPKEPTAPTPAHPGLASQESFS